MILQAYFDGCSMPNPGPSGAGVVVCTTAGVEVWSSARSLGHATNNEAEYAALTDALLWCVDHQFELRAVEIFGDSRLVVSQVNGEWQVKEPRLKPLCERAQSLRRQLQKTLTVTIAWVPREENCEADRLSKLGAQL